MFELHSDKTESGQKKSLRYLLLHCLEVLEDLEDPVGLEILEDLLENYPEAPVDR